MISLLILTAGTWSKAVTAPDLLLGDRGMRRATLMRVAKAFGTVDAKSKDGLLRLRLKPGITAQVAKARLKKKGVDYVLPGTSAVVSMDSAPSLREHTAYLKAVHRLRGEKEDEEHEKRDAKGLEQEEGGDFYESLEWFIRLRSDKTGKLDRKMYQDAVAHREQMPVSTWGDVDTRVGAPFVNIGPKSVSTPYTQYMSSGPVSGRKNGIAYAPSNTNVIYTATAGGGVWKSVNGGSYFFPLSDTWPFLNTTSVAVHPTNANIVYVGTGDYYGNFSTNSFGMMKSINGGTTWTNVGDSGMRAAPISRIIIEPTNPNIIVCTTGKGGNNDSQIHRSIDGGNTWAPVASSPGGNWDDLDRSINGTYYAVGTLPGTTGGVFRSADKGATWTAITNPADTLTEQRSMEIACSKVNNAIVYLLLPSEQKVYKSTTNGDSWTEITGNFPNGTAQDPNYNWSQGSYDYHISCGKDGTVDLLFVGLITVAMSRGGNTSWVDIGRAFAETTPNNIHSDQHSFAMNPSLPNQVLLGGDGGMFRFTQNAGKTTGVWTPLNTTFSDFLVYEFALSNTSNSYMQAGCQDNFSPSARNNYNAWTGLPAGDGCWAGFQPSGENFVTNQFGGIFLCKTLTDTNPTYIKTANTAFQTGFFAPYVYADTTNKIYGGGNTLWRYTGTGQNWTNLGTDITPFQPAQGEPANVVTELETAKSNRSIIYSGSSNGEVFLISGSGVTYKQIDNAHIDRPVGTIDTSWTNPYDVIVGLMGARNGNPRLWRCTNSNATTPVWTSVSGVGVTGLPDVPINGFERDPYDANTWYCATDAGCYMTTTAGTSWTSMSNLGLPNVLSQAIYVDAAKKFLFIGTFGRGIFRAPLATTATKYSVTGKITTVAGANVASAPIVLYQKKTRTVTVNTAPNTPIPDYDANGVYIPINITSSATVRNINAYVKITHQIPNDLEIWLFSPKNTFTKLWSSDLPVAANLAMNFQTNFFNGESTKGTWYLFVRDLGPFVTGTVNNFNLSVQYDGYAQISSSTTSATGTYSFTGLDAGLYELIPTNQGKAFTPAFTTFNLGPNAVVNFKRAN